ncbi:SET and MYND domain-containing protein 4 [Eurytemora carolleeae]|uniref:SET and MYND domain-containing protein 4 n=1 Tax=Eurytemora carolleeae TaxID=1294199 RepID=UPI000C779030|nr:SET and MYND domain-containing protein 4 [Eurytemora carolleeae]|eukprot:XP_023333559.1 SET and MYND domain-containing protein 4-like [Eurytemora affinis]
MGSLSPYDFEAFYHSICADLQTRGEVHSMSKQFSLMEDDNERMRFVLEKNLTNNLHWKDFNFTSKDRQESQKLRNLGNQVYQKNRLNEALEHYSMSICLAPHPLPPNTYINHSQDMEDNYTYEELALGYANRSAVLFQMKEYELCIRDITRAFNYSYPNNLMYKLFERKARCQRALKDYARGLESMKEAEMWMKYSTLSETKSLTFKKEISKNIEFLAEKVSLLTIDEVQNMAGLGPQTSGCLAKSPPVLENRSTEIPCASSDVTLRYTPEKGRFLVVNRDVKPGEILLVEKPYSSILLPDFYSSHCQTCCQRLLAPMPCWCCSKVRFCSEECRVEAWESFHKIECQQLDLIVGANLGKNAMLGFRILTSSGKIYLEYVVNKMKEEASKPESAPVPEKVGFNEDAAYDSSDYRTIYSLVGNTKQRGVGDLFKRGLMAAFMLKMLELTPFFFNGGSDPRNVKLQDKVLVGGILLTHLQNLPCNAHEIAEIEIPAGSVKDSAQTEIGAAAFGTLSLLNHSCDPNVVRNYYSTQAVVRSIRSLKAGDEILDNYGYHYAVMSREERQRKLYNQYYFNCDCTPCHANWPLYSSLSVSAVPLPGTQPEQAKQVVSDHHKSAKAYKRSFDLVLTGKFSESLPVLLDHLEFLDKNITRPLKEYNDCQEAIKQCYSSEGNCYRTKGKKDKEMIV